MTIPYLTAAQMHQIDKLAVKHGLLIIQMMENAGYQMADFIRRNYSGGGKILALCGKGGNGGDALATVRHLINWGYDVYSLLSSDPCELKPEPKQQYTLLINIGAQVFNYENKKHTIDFSSFDLIIDGLLGYSVKDKPRSPVDKLIKRANQSRKPIISYDLPSGMDATTGEAYEPTIRAADTLTLALPKTCFKNPRAKKYVGNLYLVDIAVPRSVYHALGLKIAPLFSRSSIVKIELKNS